MAMLSVGGAGPTTDQCIAQEQDLSTSHIYVCVRLVKVIAVVLFPLSINSSGSTSPLPCRDAGYETDLRPATLLR